MKNMKITVNIINIIKGNLIKFKEIKQAGLAPFEEVAFPTRFTIIG